MLVTVSVGANSNKFYHVTLEGNTVTKRWGRIGSDGTKSVEQTGRAGYDRIIRQKERKGYKIQPLEDSTTVGSTSSSVELADAAETYLAADKNASTIALIRFLIQENRHQIMEASGGRITVSDDGLVKTALGVVPLSSIQTARKHLNKISRNRNSRPIEELETYLTLIPQDTGRTRGWEDRFFDAGEIKKQYDFLDQLESTIQLHATNMKLQAQKADDTYDISKHADLFSMQVAAPLAHDSAEFKRINKLYESTRRSMHASRNMKLKNVYVIIDTKQQDAYDTAKKEHGNVRELWHGTSAANILSILTKGFYVPKAGDGVHITGRMFLNNGVYLSDESTKSLNYATGYWAGTHRNKNCYMFLTETVMGNEFRPRYWDSRSEAHANTGTDKNGKRYQSVFVKGGTCNVRNNEMMVWETSQIKVTYLCEFSE